MTANPQSDSTYVILVDKEDNDIGMMEKMEAHRIPLLHRAVSVFVTNSKGEWILQQRALGKYHSKGLWTNTCCSHPYPSETSFVAAHRRLVEEMGIDCQLKEVFSFIYKEPVNDELIEYEFDHVFVGVSDDIPKLNCDEVLDWKAISFSDLDKDIRSFPDLYTIWFRKLYQQVSEFQQRGEGEETRTIINMLNF